MLHRQGDTEINWSGNVRWHPERIYYPETLQDIQEVIRYASTNNKKVRAVGSKHSISDCAAHDGLQINTQRLNRVLSFDKDTLMLEVESGIVLRDLYAFMDAHGVALPSTPNTDAITIGGAIANCTHGTNVHFGTFSSYVRKIKMVTARGELLSLDREDGDEKAQNLFEASLANLGALGIYYSVTLQLVPTYDIVCKKRTMHIQDVMTHIRQIAAAHDSAQFMVFPFSDVVLVKTQEKARVNSLAHGRTWSLDNFSVEGMIFLLSAKKHAIISSLCAKIFTPRFFSLWFRILYASRSVGVWWAAEVTGNKSKFFNMEYAVPLARIEETLQELFRIAQEFKESSRYTRTLPFILRPVGADEKGFLSPTYMTESCYIDILFQAYDDKEIAFYKEIEKAILALGGRVAWSKKFFAAGSDILSTYPKHNEFLAMMEDLDPSGMFLNDYTKRIFYSENAA